MSQPKEALTPASEQLLRDFDRTPDAIDYSELSARLWLIERQAAAPVAGGLDAERLAVAWHKAFHTAEGGPCSTDREFAGRLARALAASQPVAEGRCLDCRESASGVCTMHNGSAALAAPVAGGTTCWACHHPSHGPGTNGSGCSECFCTQTEYVGGRPLAPVAGEGLREIRAMIERCYPTTEALRLLDVLDAAPVASGMCKSCERKNNRDQRSKTDSDFKEVYSVPLNPDPLKHVGWEFAQKMADKAKDNKLREAVEIWDKAWHAVSDSVNSESRSGNYEWEDLVRRRFKRAEDNLRNVLAGLPAMVNEDIEKAFEAGRKKGWKECEERYEKLGIEELP